MNKDVIFADGSIIETNLDELFECADIFAHHYGMAGCKSFTEFVNMINEEDPFVLISLQKAIIKRVELQNGRKRPNFRREEIVDSKNDTGETKFGFEQQHLITFLKRFGANPKEIDEAIVKIKSGQIQLPKHDFSWITPDNLANLDFKTVIKQMQEDYDNSVKIKVDMDGFHKRSKEIGDG